MDKTHHEDRLMTLEQVTAVTERLHAEGFKHVVCTHTIDPKWAEVYRANRPEIRGTAWSVRLNESFVPMPMIKKLIDICEALGMTFWLSSYGDHGGDEGSGPEIYVRIKRKGEPE